MYKKNFKIKIVTILNKFLRNYSPLQKKKKKFKTKAVKQGLLKIKNIFLTIVKYLMTVGVPLKENTLGPC